MKRIAILSFLIIICSAALVPDGSGGRQLRCRFIMTHHVVLLHDTYACEVSGSFAITRRNDQVYSIVGDHMIGKSNDDVVAFKADAARFEYFPRGIERFLKNLKSIVINFSRLKEIRQVDLKPFTKLRHIDLFDNKIEVIEADLFKFNPELEEIWLSSNNIKIVDVTAFDGLTKLKALYMSANLCVSDSAITNYGILRLFSKLKLYCQPSTDPVDPNQITTPEPIVNYPTLDPNATELQELRFKLIITQDEVLMLKDKREEILMKWTQVEEQRDQLKKNQTDLLKQIEEFEKLNKVLNDTIAQGNSESVTYIREAFKLKIELQRQLNNFDRIANDYKAQLNSVNLSLNAVTKERNEYKDESKMRLIKSLEFRDKFEELQAKKESHDIVMIIAICLLIAVLGVVLGPSIYRRFAGKSVGGFNSFENTMQVKMMEVREEDGQ